MTSAEEIWARPEFGSKSARGHGGDADTDGRGGNFNTMSTTTIRNWRGSDGGRNRDRGVGRVVSKSGAERVPLSADARQGNSRGTGAERRGMWQATRELTPEWMMLEYMNEALDRKTLELE